MTDYQPYSIHRLSNIETYYSTFSVGSSYSRPIASSVIEADGDGFMALEERVLNRLRVQSPLGASESNDVTRYIYTAVMSVASAFDIWQPGSRKSPGTFFEVFMAALFQLHMTNVTLSKHINLGALLGTDTTAEEAVARELTGSDEEEEESSVSTDLVATSRLNGLSAVLPLKITTRERVVQPFAHQRILESSFPGRYFSFLCCISETQLDKKTHSVKQICVPGTIKLFQRFLSPMNGIYYCDPPVRYTQPSLTNIIPVKKLGEVFNDVRSLLAA
ncbi:MAG: hypothetical protein AB7O56_07785 [Bauldia sp.]